MPVYKGSTLVNGVNVRIENTVSSGGITPAGTIDISSNGTYDVTEYASANVNVPEKEFTTQTKTATPSTSQQIITPDSGYDGLSRITVEAMPSGSLSTPTISSSGLITAQVGTSGYLASGTKVTKQLTTQAAKTVTPTASEQTVVNSAVYTTGAVKVAAVPSETKTITANGTYTPSSGKYLTQVTVNVPASGIDTSDATATANDIAEGKTAYADSKKLEGSLADYQAGAEATFASNHTEVSDDSAINFLCRGLNQGAKILRDGSYVKVYVKKTEFGDASAADVAQGKTFTSSSGLKVTGTHICSGGIDTSDATATASDIAEGVTAYANGEKITGTIQKASTVYNLGLPEVQAEKINDTRIRLGMTTLSGPIIVGRGVTVRVGIDSDKISNVLGDATPEDVASGKTFSAGGGFTMVGTATASTPSLQEKSVTPSATEQTVTPDSGYDGLSRVTVEAMPTAALSTPTISVDSAGKITAKVEQTASGYVEAGSKSATKQLTTKGAATITPGTSDQTIASGTYLTGAQTIKGDANLVAGNIKSGVSIFGVAGSFEGSGGGGGSSDNNCEAYHITSASATLNFKTTGTVKVWGYGTVTSGYSTSVCAFVGDGYYKSASWGSPTKTSASFSINSNGTLNGLPSGLQTVDLLVTIGV